MDLYKFVFCFDPRFHEEIASFLSLQWIVCFPSTWDQANDNYDLQHLPNGETIKRKRQNTSDLPFVDFWDFASSRFANSISSPLKLLKFWRCISILECLISIMINKETMKYLHDIRENDNQWLEDNLFFSPSRRQNRGDEEESPIKRFFMDRKTIILNLQNQKLKSLY